MKHLTLMTQHKAPALAISLLVWEQKFTVITAGAGALVAITEVLEGLAKGE